MSIFIKSETESKLYGIEIARRNRMETYDAKAIQKEVIENQLDCIRFKISLNNKNLFDEIKKTGYQYDIYNIISSATFKLTDQFLAPKFDEGVTFKLYDGTESPELKETIEEVVDILFKYGNNSQLYKTVFDIKKLKQAAIAYYLDFIHEKHEDKLMYLAYFQGKFFGCYCLAFSDNEVDTPLALVSKEFRHTGLFKNLKAHGSYISKLRGTELGVVDTPITNLSSFVSKFSYGIMPTNSYINVVMYPMISQSKQSIGNVEVSENTSVDVQLNEVIGAYLRKQSIKNYSRSSFSYTSIHPVQDAGLLNIKVSKLFRNEHYFFIAGVTELAQEIQGNFHFEGFFN